MSTLGETLTMPLVNLRLDPPGQLDLGASKVLPVDTISGPVRRSLAIGTYGVFQYPGMPAEYVWQAVVDNIGERDLQGFLDRTLTIFKLFKDSTVLANRVVLGDPPHASFDARHYIPWGRETPTVYVLRNSEQKDFSSFWEKMRTIDVSNFALYRFHLADFRPYLSDRFADYVESMEYLFVPDSDEGEIGYKFRSRGTMVLGHDKCSAEREVLYGELQKAYGLRSAIVHGNTDKITEILGKTKWEDKIRLVREYDRYAINFFFAAGCLEDANKRRELMQKRLIFDSGFGWKTPDEFGTLTEFGQS